MQQSSPIEDIVEDFIDLYRSGKAVSAESFAAAYPEHRAELMELLPLVADMEKLNVSWDADNLPELNDCDFKLLKKIGCGGMGSIYEAEQISLQRRVAIKVLSPRLFDDENQRAQFVNEAKLIAQLHHPHIIKIIDAKSSGVYCYYVMELIEGASLDHVPLADIKDVARIGIQAAQALDYAHNCGILHRDIKPGNFMLDQSNFLHLGDFGLSILQAQHSGSYPETAGGTLRYMAPEQLSSNENSVQSDIYALGATLYELAFSQPLFSAHTTQLLKEQICSGTPLIPRKTPRGLAAILKKCLHRDPAERYQSAADVASDLQKFLNNEVVSAEKSSCFYRFYLWVKRKPMTAAWAVAASLCLAAAFGALFVGIQETEKALGKAEFNAKVADQTLEKIFIRVSALPPSQENNRLLSELLPYYQQIIRSGKLPEEKIYSACQIITQSAIRSGDYPLAEDALRQIIKMRNASASKNMLAMVLQKQHKIEEADELYRQVISQCENSPVPQQKVEAVKALLAQSQPDKSRAFTLLEDLLSENPDVPEYRCQYAILLGSEPRLSHQRRIAGVEPNAIRILTELSQKYPEQPEYATALIKMVLRNLNRSRFIARIWEETTQTVELSEQMLSRYPNDPELTENAIALHIKYIDQLRKRGEFIQSRKYFDRLLSVLEVLFYNPEVSNTARENLLELQFKRAVELNQRPGKTEIINKIAKELQLYKGQRQNEFQEKYKELTQY